MYKFTCEPFCVRWDKRELFAYIKKKNINQTVVWHRIVRKLNEISLPNDIKMTGVNIVGSNYALVTVHARESYLKWQSCKYQRFILQNLATCPLH